jgi:subtilisin family serine protease
VKPQIARTAAAIGIAVLFAPFSLPGTGHDAIAQVSLPPVSKPLDPLLDPNLRRPRDDLDTRTRRRAEEARKAAETAPIPSPGDTLPDADTAAVKALADVGEIGRNAVGTVDGLLRTFVADVDPNGLAIEKDVVVMLLDDKQLALLGNGRFDIISQRELRSLGLTIVTLRDPKRATPGQAVSDLQAALPDAAIDFNHIYRYATDANGTGKDVSVETADAAGKASRLRIGMIDSAVAPEHFSLRDSEVTTADFVTTEGKRPLGHGTAVASLIARSADNEAQILAASVFFETQNFAPGATTESLVAALDWLAAQQVDVINMSLSGPANRLLEKAVTSLVAQGQLLVAAVGNNGPSGEPLYPAAYDGVIGVTAIDRDKRVFRYANRGPQVDFAALGVDVKVADASGSWRLESGTSMASPRVAVVIAQARHASDLPTITLLELLSGSAEDLGRKGFDPVFGYGLLTSPPVLLSDTPNRKNQ